jgi:hypothetical protein
VPYPELLSAPLARVCEGKSRDQLVFGDGLVYFPRAGIGQGWFWAAVHDLRHTAASLAISAWANPKAVQRMLGHASAAMTLDTYADLFEDDLFRRRFGAFERRASGNSCGVFVGFGRPNQANSPVITGNTGLPIGGK